MLNENNEVLYSRSAQNVPLKRNRITTLTGTLFNNTGVTSSFQVNEEWLTGHSVNF